MVRNADRDYYYQTFTHNAHLDEIDAINFSKPVRQNRPMYGHYAEATKPYKPLELCSIHQDVWYGGFSRDTHELLGYAQLKVFDSVGLLNMLLGHSNAVGVINGLICHLNDNANVELINYLRMASATETLTAFKYRLGFRPWKEVDESK